MSDDLAGRHRVGDEIDAEEILALARAAGFDGAGVTTARPFASLLPQLRRYYEEGRASGFEHPVAEERIDPDRVLAGARSLVAVVLAYRTAQTVALRRPQGRRGVVSVYAWGEDYHRVMKDKLARLAVALEAAVGRPVRSVACVDTSPLVDRAVAQRASVGWIGKNCCLITPDYGSWVFLGTLVTDVQVAGCADEPDAGPEDEAGLAPEAVAEGGPDARAGLDLNGCGECDLCLRACPTGALREPFILDSSICLSHLTQMKGMPPEAYREALGRRVWGCDTCQSVCPKNHASLLATETAFRPDPELSFPELRRLLTLSSRAFLREYGHTAAAWRGARTWRRNAALALGNARAREALPDLTRLLEDPHPDMRAAAAWALRKIDPAASAAAVAAARERETDLRARAEMEWAAEKG